MTRNWIVVNLALLLIAGLLGRELYVSVKRFNRENDLSKLQPTHDPKKITPGDGLPALPPARQYNAAEFAAIPGENIFSESRGKEDKVDTPAPETPPLAVKPVLVGVTISGDQRRASIVDPTVPGTARRSQTKRIGDNYQGYTITEITTSQIVLTSGTRREIISLHDGAKRPAPGGKTAIIATRVVSIGGATAASGVAPSIIPSSAGQARPAVAAAPGQPVTTVIGGPPNASGSAAPNALPQNNAQAGAARTNLQQGRPTQGNSPQPPLNPGERIDEQGRRVIRTPFGDVVREPSPNP